MKNSILLLLIACLTLLWSCTEQDLFTYGEQNYIYFEDEASGDDAYPGMAYTFVFEDADLTTTTFGISVLVTGRFTGTDRTFTIRPVDSLSTAQEGVHYQILDEINVIADQAVGGAANIQLYRTDDLADTEVTLVLELIGDENFLPGINALYEIRFSDFFAEPEWWPYEAEATDYFPTIGPFTQIKAGYWLEFYGIEDGSDPWCCQPYWDGVSYNDTPGFDYPLVNVALCQDDIATFKFWLATLEEECSCVLRDENGDRILDTMEY